MQMLLRPIMTALGGRPKKDDGDQATRQIRVFADLAELLGWRARIEGKSTANLLDPLIRGPLLAWAEVNKDIIEKIKQAEAEANRLTEEALKLAQRRKSKRE